MASFMTRKGRYTSPIRKMSETTRVELAKALDESIRIVQATAINLAPTRTGRLRKALASPSAIGRRKGGTEVEFGLRTKALQKKAFYAPFVEYGTKAYSAGGLRFRGTTAAGTGRYRKVKRNIPARPARPFLRPAIKLTIPFWRKAVSAALRRALNKVSLRG